MFIQTPHKVKQYLYKTLTYLLILSHIQQVCASHVLVERGLKESKVFSPLNDRNLESQKLFVEKDEDGCVLLHFDKLNLRPFSELYDGKTLIGTVHFQDRSLSFNSHGSSHFKVLSELDLDELSCRIKGSITFVEAVKLSSLILNSEGQVTFKRELYSDNKVQISANNFLAEETISANNLRIKAKESALFLGNIIASNLICRIAQTLQFGDETKNPSVQILENIGLNVTQLKNYGKLETEFGKVVVRAKDIFNNEDALIKSSKKLNIATVSLENKGRIKAKENCRLTTSELYNKGLLKIKKALILICRDIIENSGNLAYGNGSSIEAKLLSNLGTWKSEGKNSFHVSENLYNSHSFFLSGLTTITTPILYNFGKIAALGFLQFKGDSIDNNKDISIDGVFSFDTQEDFVNRVDSNFTVKGKAGGTFRSLLNKGTFAIEGSFTSKGQKLFNDFDARWKVSQLWQHESHDFILDGQVDTGFYATLFVTGAPEFHAHLHGHALQVTSEGPVSCRPSSAFDLTHFLNINSKGSIDFDSQILTRRLAGSPDSSLDESLLTHVKSLSKGIFLKAVGAIKKQGRAIAEQGSVSLKTDGSLTHEGYTESGTNSGDSLSFTSLKLMKIFGTVISHGTMNLVSGDDLDLMRGSQLQADVAQLKAAKDISTAASVAIEKAIATKSRHFTNTGIIEAESALFKADRTFSNEDGGRILSKDLAINAMFSLNIFGELEARNLTINSLFDLNFLGIRSAYSAQINSLFVLNAGLNIPRIDSWDDIFNYNNLKNAGQSLFLSYAPPAWAQLYQVGRAAYRAPALVRQAKHLWKSAQSLNGDDVGFSDIIPLICGAKDLATSTYLAASSLHPMYKSYQKGSFKEDASLAWQDMKTFSFRKPDLFIAANALGTIGPHFNTDSLLSINCGATLGVNGYDRSLWNYNYGIQGFANNYTLYTADGHNYGLTGATRLRVDATNAYRSRGGLFGAEAVISGGDLDIGGYTGFSNSFSAQGNSIIYSAKGLGRTKNFSLVAKNDLTYQGQNQVDQGLLKGKNVDYQGQLTGAKQTSVLATENLTTSAGSAIESEELTMQGKNLSHGGKAEGAKVTMHGSESTTLEDGSVTKGNQVNVGGKIQKTTNADGKEVIETTLSKNTTVKEGAIVEGQGKNSRVSVEAEEKATIEQGAKVTADNALLEAKVAEQNGDFGGGEVAVVFGTEKTEIGEESKTTANQVLTGVKMTSVEDTNGNQTIKTVLSKNTTVKEGATVEGQGENSRVSVEAEEKATIEQGAKVSANNASLQAKIAEQNGEFGGGEVAVVFGTEKSELGEGSKTTANQVLAGIKTISTQDANGNQTIETVLSKNTSVKDEATVEGQGEKSRVSVEAKEKAIIEKGAKVSASNASLQAKIAEQNGEFGGGEVAIVFGTEKTELGDDSRTQAKHVVIGHNGQSRSKETRTASGAKVQGKQNHIAGDKLRTAAEVQGDTRYEADDGKILRPEATQSSNVEVQFQKYEKGAQGAIDLANQMKNAESVFVDASQYAWRNRRAQSILGQHRAFRFSNVSNHAFVDADGSLFIDGINGFETTQDMFAKKGISTISSNGVHKTINGAVIGSNGVTYVDGAKGRVLQSVLTKDNQLKRAGYEGDIVVHKSGDYFENTAGQIFATEIYSIIEGDQIEKAIKCPANIISVNIDGSRSRLTCHRNAENTYARTDYRSKIAREEIWGKLLTEAGKRSASVSGLLFAAEGVKGTCLHHKFVANKGYDRPGFLAHGYCEWEEEDTDFYRPTFKSQNGAYDVISPQGLVTLEAPIFDVAKQSSMYGRDGVDLLAKKVMNFYRYYATSGFGVLESENNHGFKEKPQVADVTGRDKIFFISPEGALKLQAPNLFLQKGGGFLAAKGVQPVPLVLYSSNNHSRSGFYVSCIGNRPLETLHPMIGRGQALAGMEDGVTGAASDAAGIVTSAYNTTNHASRSYNNNTGATDFLMSELGAGRATSGYEDRRGHRQLQQQVPGSLYSGGEFIIQTNEGQGADLSHFNVDIARLNLDTDFLRLHGCKHLMEQQSQTYNGALSYDFYQPTDLTVSINYSENEARFKSFQKTRCNIGVLDVRRPDSRIDISNADLSIHKSLGEDYSIHAADKQDEQHLDGLQFGCSASFDAVTGMPTGAGWSGGYQDHHTYTTPSPSVIEVHHGNNLKHLSHEVLEDKTEGSSCFIDVNSKPLDNQTAFAMPVSVSGQSGSSRYRLQPVLFNQTAFEQDVQQIQQARKGFFSQHPDIDDVMLIADQNDLAHPEEYWNYLALQQEQNQTETDVSTPESSYFSDFMEGAGNYIAEQLDQSREILGDMNWRENKVQELITGYTAHYGVEPSANEVKEFEFLAQDLYNTAIWDLAVEKTYHDFGEAASWVFHSKPIRYMFNVKQAYWDPLVSYVAGPINGAYEAMPYQPFPKRVFSPDEFKHHISEPLVESIFLAGLMKGTNQLKNSMIPVYSSRNSYLERELQHSLEASLLRTELKFTPYTFPQHLQGHPPLSHQIGKGHGFWKHVYERGEFPEFFHLNLPPNSTMPNWKLRQYPYIQAIEDVLADPSTLVGRAPRGNRVGYYHESSNVLTIVNPRHRDGGTMFKPTDGKAYFNRNFPKKK